MRFDLWSTIKGKLPRRRSRAAAVIAPKQKTPSPPANKPPARQTPALAAASHGALDPRAIWHDIVARKNFIIMPTLLAAVVSLAIVNMIAPLYKSEARIWADGRENAFPRPADERAEEGNAFDPKASASQVQLILSRDLARMVIKQNNLAELPEFDPVLQGVSPLKMLLGLIGIGRDPFRVTPEERVLDAYFDRLSAFAIDKSRVIAIEFQSRDPELAARVANSVVDNYLVLRQAARQQQAKAASQRLSGEIDSQRKRVAEAEQRAEAFRSESGLFVGANTSTLPNQQLGELTSQLNSARALKADAETKARMIRDMLKSGKPIEASEVLNSELIRRLSEQRATLRVQLAELSSTLLGGHPRIKELKARIADLDHQIREEAGKLSRALENDARAAEARVENLNASLDQLKRQATSTGDQDVKLRTLDREAKAARDLLESQLAEYREATARESIDPEPAEGRIISRAVVANTSSYPKKLPIVLISTLAMLMLTAGYVASGEWLRTTPPRTIAAEAPVAGRAPSIVAAMPDGDVAPRMPEPAAVWDPDGQGLRELERLAAALQAPGVAARKLSVLAAGPVDGTSRTALVLARLLARRAKVVLVDLSASPMLRAASAEGAAPGLAELMRGQASFGQVITRDRDSSVNLVSAGRAGADRALLRSPRLTLALDALLRTYDHVLLDAGAADDLPAGLLTRDARAIVVPDDALSVEARRSMSDQLRMVGFSDVTMLSRAVTMDLGGRDARFVAA
ncbi:MAG: exopolysaccharide transport family protein [Xanthobacteraceae bacterium]|nr:exopolysaccharide transport family protein [Xanthobacteraceae bacterium]